MQQFRLALDGGQDGGTRLYVTQLRKGAEKMMMTVKETPKETRVSIYNERNSKSAGRIKGKQPGERSPQSISRTKSKVRDIVAW